MAEYYQAALGVDAGYAGMLAHNPTPQYRRVEFSTEWGASRPYSLDQLANVIPFGWKAPRHPWFYLVLRPNASTTLRRYSGWWWP